MSMDGPKRRPRGWVGGFLVVIGGCPTDLTLRGFTSGTHRTPDDGVVVVSA